MRIDHIIWGTTGVIVTIALATQTNILKNLANRVGSRGQVGFGYGYPYGYDCGSGFDPITELQDLQLQSGSDQQEPNFTQPLVTPEQARKNTEHQHKQKQHKHHDDEQQVYAQIECPDDPNTLPCGSNCYHNGQLWKTACSEEQRQELFPPSEPQQQESSEENETAPASPDYTIHYNPWFTPSPWFTPTPYQQGQEPPPQPIPTGPGPQPPSQNNIHPTNPEQNYADRNAQYDATKPSYMQSSPSSLHFTPYKSHGANTDGCYNGKISEGKRDTCRWQADLSSLYGTDYTISATVTPGSFSPTGHRGGGKCIPEGCSDRSGCGGCHPRVEITSGGPGSSHDDGGTCCGFTLSINNNDGTMHMEGEGAAETFAYYCDDGLNSNLPACTQKGASVTGGKPVYGQTLGINWMKCGQRYGGVISGPSGTVPATGVAWAPGNPRVGLLSGKQQSDSTRIRVDSAGQNVNFHGGPKVYTNPCTGGYG